MKSVNSRKTISSTHTEHSEKKKPIQIKKSLTHRMVEKYKKLPYDLKLTFYSILFGFAIIILHSSVAFIVFILNYFISNKNVILFESSARILHLNDALTTTSSLYVFTENHTWIDKYDNYADLLFKDINVMLKNAPTYTLKKLDGELSISLQNVISIDENIFNYTENGNRTLAQQVLNSSPYKQDKSNLLNGIKELNHFVEDEKVNFVFNSIFCMILSLIVHIFLSLLLLIIYVMNRSNLEKRSNLLKIVCESLLKFKFENLEIIKLIEKEKDECNFYELLLKKLIKKMKLIYPYLPIALQEDDSDLESDNSSEDDINSDCASTDTVDSVRDNMSRTASYNSCGSIGSSESEDFKKVSKKYSFNSKKSQKSGSRSSNKIIEKVLELREITCCTIKIEGLLANFLQQKIDGDDYLFLHSKLFQIIKKAIKLTKGNCENVTNDTLFVTWNSRKRMKNHAVRAISCLQKIDESLQRMAILVHEKTSSFMKKLKISISCGVSTGICYYGHFGKLKNKTFKVLGRPIKESEMIQEICSSENRLNDDYCRCRHLIDFSTSKKCVDEFPIKPYKFFKIIGKGNCLFTITDVKRTTENKEWMYQLEDEKAIDFEKSFLEVIGLYLKYQCVESRKKMLKVESEYPEFLNFFDQNFKNIHEMILDNNVIFNTPENVGICNFNDMY